MTDLPLPRFAIVPAEEAAVVRQGGTAMWFEQLMDGNMLRMVKRPILSEPMRTRMQLQSFKMRTKACGEPHVGEFYVWFQSQKEKPEVFPADEDVDTSQAEVPDDFDPLSEVG